MIVPGTLELVEDADSTMGDQSVSMVLWIDDVPPGATLQSAACMLPTRSGGVHLYGDMLRYDGSDTEYVLP